MFKCIYIYYFVLVKGCVCISVRDDENERVREKAISLSSEKSDNQQFHFGQFVRKSQNQESSASLRTEFKFGDQDFKLEDSSSISMEGFCIQ